MLFSRKGAKAQRNAFGVWPWGGELAFSLMAVLWGMGMVLREGAKK
jgi:hypothetical protein